MFGCQAVGLVRFCSCFVSKIAIRSGERSAVDATSARADGDRDPKTCEAPEHSTVSHPKRKTFFPTYEIVMSQADDAGAAIDLSTGRGRDYPTIRQFTIFLENKVGTLQAFLRRFIKSDVRILAFNINDSTECSVLRCILSHPEQGREILERAGLAMIESDLIAVQLRDCTQPLLDVCGALLRAEVNLVQTYPLMVRSDHGPTVAIMVDNIDQAMETLKSHSFNMLNEDDLKELY